MNKIVKSVRRCFYIFINSIVSSIQDWFSGKEADERDILDDNNYKILRTSIEKELISSKNQPQWLFPQETKLVQSIREDTAKWNVNNITRTKAYWAFYNRNPEVHWALLAHMVSRNGGYHMTDLKGSALEHLIKEKEKQSYFLFLEHSNSAIFSDAYPQLLLYEQAKRTGLSLRKNLPLFHISRFMYPVWETFIKDPNPLLLTTALIINEQRMLQKRVLSKQNHANILKKIDFQLQELFGLTAVIFPHKEGRQDLYSLTGVIVNQFQDPKMRIMTGKKLYQLLFQDPKIYKGVCQFADSVTHTGSRSDYWDTIFTKNKFAGKIYSPILVNAWSDIPPMQLSKADWFDDSSYIEELKTYPIIPKQDITEKVLENVSTLQLLNEVKGII
ncbi:DUF2515 domain-containing protein [Peribacillus saganii]|uniref:DUF2515 domain-containing protein n=1 Tax=Peribacillus saganii TaxID=2303992 RepID=A0A372LSD5_9BACI|nr:DUF2515 family protein [Peribacillus saganii]RFU70464.1 DUF2515 domain-containing protein [Peribacillus saganii]